jgi:hypothetical protein
MLLSRYAFIGLLGLPPDLPPDPLAQAVTPQHQAAQGPCRPIPPGLRQGDEAKARAEDRAKAVDQFDSMTDDELRQYIYGDKDLKSDQ